LRIVNWTFFYSFFAQRLEQDNADGFRETMLGSLYRQARYLYRNLEFELLGNHLVANAQAMLFAGLLFRGDEAGRWLLKGVKLLADEAAEQILDDGMHFERSHMYHCTVLLHYLECCALASRFGIKPLAGLLPKIEQMARFAMVTSHPDGRIPLFGDSAFDVALEPVELATLCSLLKGTQLTVPQEDVRSFPAAGYYVIADRDNAMFCIIDGGPIGPDYLPAHGHCDVLSFELSLEEQRFIVDTGVHSYYQSAELRRYARSTAAHNTVRVDGEEQGEIWARFRLARRPRSVEASLRNERDSIVFRGSHDGYRRLRGQPRHHRELVYRKGEYILIRDTVTGAGEHEVESFLHFAPDLRIEQSGTVVSVRGDSRSIRILIPPEPSSVRTELTDGLYFPQFGVQEPNKVLVLRARGDVPLSIGYAIALRADIDQSAIEW